MLVANALVVLGLLTSPVARPACTEPGKSRWGVKSNVPRPSSIVNAKRVALKDLLALEDPNPAPVKFQPERGLIAPSPNSLGVHEGQLIRTRGYLRLVATEDNDCEYHIQLTTTPQATSSLIVEVAKEDAVSIPSAFVRARAKEVRAWIRNSLFQGAEPPGGGKLVTPPVYVEVVGQLFFDSAHGKNDARGKHGMPSRTRWELHPVLFITRAR